MDRHSITRRLTAETSAPRSESRSIAGSESWIVSPTMSGVYVTEDTVLNIGAYYAGVSVLCQDISSIPFQVVKRDADGSLAIDESNPIHELVSCDPDPIEQEMAAMSWVASQVWHLLTHGNSYSRIKRDEYHRPIGLELLDPRKVWPRRKVDGRLYYDVFGEAFFPSDILHVSAVGFDGIVGRSPVRQARETLGITMGAEKFGASRFGNGINPGGVIELPDDMDEVEEKELRKNINREHQGPYAAHKFMILSGGTKFTPTSIPFADVEFLATRKFQLAEICRILRIPPTKLQDFDKASFSNIEETNQDYYTSSLKPWLKRFQVEFNRKLFDRSQRRIWRVDHDVSETLRGRMLDQAQVDKIYREMGVLNADEIRARHGWGKVKGGQVYMTPLNFAPLDKVAEASIETLKGVKALDPPKGPDAAAPSDTVDTTVLDADGATVDGLRSVILDGARTILLETARRMVKREANAIRKIARKGDLATILDKLDQHYLDEEELLVEAYGSSLSLYSSLAPNPIDTRAFAAELVKRSRAELLACVEGPETIKALNALADRWDSEKPGQLVDLAFHLRKDES
jgi:HK97 family phage portal protein